MENLQNKNEYWIIRAKGAGVFAGNIESRNGDEVVATNVRRLWYWDGANSLSQLAQEGTLKPQNCKFSVAVNKIIIMNALELDLCTESAEKSIKGVAVWKQ